MFKLILLLTFLCSMQVHGNPTKNKKGSKALVTIGDREYFFSSTAANVQVATETCTELGMKLASLDSEVTNTAIKNYLISVDLGTTVHWTSGRRLQNMFHWAGTGKIVSYTDWMDLSYPVSDPSSPYCIGVYGEGGWEDRPCTNIVRFICERLIDPFLNENQVY